LLVSEACLVIVADTHFFMWTWRSLLYVGTSVETMPAPSITFALDPIDEKLMPRADFSTLDLRGHVLLGGNQGFVLYDIAAEAPLFRYELSTAFAIASFHAVRWSGECVVTLEAAGVRIWRVFPLAGVQELGGGTTSESGVAPRVPAVTARSPPELIAPDETHSTFCSLYADADCVLLGDSLGRMRVVPLASGRDDDSSSKKAHGGALDRRESAKLTALTTTTNANDIAVKMSAAAAARGQEAARGGGGEPTTTTTTTTSTTTTTRTATATASASSSRRRAVAIAAASRAARATA
jgi:hypothetical protein